MIILTPEEYFHLTVDRHNAIANGCTSSFDPQDRTERTISESEYQQVVSRRGFNEALNNAIEHINKVIEESYLAKGNVRSAGKIADERCNSSDRTHAAIAREYSAVPTNTGLEATLEIHPSENGTEPQ